MAKKDTATRGGKRAAGSRGGRPAGAARKAAPKKTARGAASKTARGAAGKTAAKKTARKAAPARAAKKTTGRGASKAAAGAAARKTPRPAGRAKTARSSERGRTQATARKQAGARGAAGTGARGRKAPARRPSGSQVSRSTARAKWVESPDDISSRPGQTLATRSHEVIQRWAEERSAVPATTPGGDAEDPRVLRFNFPGFGGQNLQEVSWDAWFRTFDDRNLVFLFQDRMKAGNQSNFFQFDNPEREDA